VNQRGRRTGGREPRPPPPVCHDDPPSKAREQTDCGTEQLTLHGLVAGRDAPLELPGGGKREKEERGGENIRSLPR